MTTNTDPVRALAELVGAAGLMLSEIDTCGHPVDPAYRATLHDAWTNGQAALASAPPSATMADNDARLSAKELLVSACIEGSYSFTAEAIEAGIGPSIPFGVAVSALNAALAQQPAAPSGEVGELKDSDILWDMRHIEPHLKDVDEAVPTMLRGVRKAINRATAAQQPAAVDEAMELVRDIAEQKPEKPDYWSSCGQCESNIDRAQEVLAAQQQGGAK